jgi:ribosomal protein S18 acetylase RimI-like enzyme
VNDTPVLEIRVLRPGDEHVLGLVAPDVFDELIDLQLAREFLRDERHHLVVALEANLVIGFASGVTYLHPDKPLELWINEVGVAPTHQRRGVGRNLVDALLDLGRTLGCQAAWVLTERSNASARRLYGSAGGLEATEDTILYAFALRKQTSS